MNNNFAKFIDELRESRNISREAFVEDIISLRQYYRFQKGESSLKNDVIEQLLSKLEISHTTAYKYYYNKYNEINSDLEEIYQLIYNRNIKEAETQLKNIDYSKLIYTSQKKFHRIIELIVNTSLNKYPYNLAAKEVIDIIDYPKILKKELLSFYETAGLVFLMNHLIGQKDIRFGEKVYEYITDSNKLESKDNFLKYTYKMPFYMSASQLLGHLKKFDESISVAKLSIKEIFNNGDLVMLMYFHLLLAMGYKSLDDEQYKDNVRKVFMLLAIEGNKERYKEFSEKIEKMFMLKESDLIIYK